MWLLLLALVALLLLADWIRKRFGGLQLPQPGVWPVFGHALLFPDAHRVDSAFMEVHRQLGRPRVFKLNLLGETSVVLVDAEDTRAVTAVRRSRGPDWDETVFFGRGISGLLPGERHAALRKFFHPFVNSPKHMDALEPTLRLHCDILVDKIRQNAKTGAFFDLQQLLDYSMFDLAVHVVFGFNPDTISGASETFWQDWEIQNEARHANFSMTAAIFRVFPFWRWFKTAWVRRWERSKQRIAAQMLEYVHKCHAECQSNPNKRPGSILEYYFLSEKGALCELSDDECVRHALNFVWGAVDSTRCTVCFAIAESTRNATLTRELQRELDAQLSDQAPTLAQVMGNSVPKLHNWISEVLRLHPAFPFFPVVLEERVQLRSDPSIVLEKGTIAVAFPGAMQRDADNWNNAETFDPNRFDKIDAAGLKGFQPFGGGTRRCLGERLGMFDVRFFVAALLKNFDFEAKSATFETLCPISKRIAGEYLVKAIERK